MNCGWLKLENVQPSRMIHAYYVYSTAVLAKNRILTLCYHYVYCVIHFHLSGAINIHPSLLPQWKGAAPMSHAILNGAKETGISIVEVSRERSI